MFNDLKAEMARYDISIEELAIAIGISRQALSSKLNNRTKFVREEMWQIKDYLNGKGGDFTVDTLFKVKGENV